jgi:hypothetical protein
MITQQELAKKIRDGYAKHGATLTDTAYVQVAYKEMCPVFAAFSVAFETLQAASDVLTTFWSLDNNVDFLLEMAKSLNADISLIRAISALFDFNAVETDLDIVLNQLDNNVFPIYQQG